MATLSQNIITIKAKEACVLPVEVYMSNGKAYTPPDNCKIIFTVKESVNNRNYVIQKEVADGAVSLDVGDTNISPGYYTYDLELVAVNGYTDTIVPPTFFIVIEGENLSRNIDITRYLPAVTNKCNAIIAVCRSENSELSTLWDSMVEVLYNQFISTAIEEGLTPWEKIFGVIPEAAEKWADRRFRILLLLRGSRPFTDRKLEEMLTSICGADGYVIERDYKNYALTVKVNLGIKKQLEQTRAMLETVVPMNIGLTVTLNYNRHRDLKAKFTHGDMKKYSHHSLREDPL